MCFECGCGGSGSPAVDCADARPARAADAANRPQDIIRNFQPGRKGPPCRFNSIDFPRSIARYGAGHAAAAKLHSAFERRNTFPCGAPAILDSARSLSGECQSAQTGIAALIELGVL